jgi:predicted DNA-binding transcriptional regulator AlpA
MTLKRWMEKEGFPLPIQLGPNTVAWCESKIEAWLASRQREDRL